VHVGFRAIICDECIGALRRRLSELDGSEDDSPPDWSVAGRECVFCERILTTADFSLSRWIFGMCNVCACSIAGANVQYAGSPAQDFKF
jgi:hypothetical protein